MPTSSTEEQRVHNGATWAFDLLLVTAATVLAALAGWLVGRRQRRPAEAHRRDASPQPGKRAVSARVGGSASTSFRSGLDALFVARMSHDLRSPLNSVVTLSELLRDGNAGPLSAEQRRYVDVIRHSSSTLLGLINDVLELAAVESGRAELDQGPVDLTAVAHDVAETLASAANAKGIPVHVVTAGLPILARTDGDELRRVVQRLAEHALAETSNGYVEIEVRRAADRQALIRIHETGASLSDAAVGAMTGEQGDLDAFVAGEEGFAGRGPATLPLILAARLARAIGVRIEVDSTATEKVTFELGLPLVESTSKPSDEFRASRNGLGWAKPNLPQRDSTSSKAAGAIVVGPETDERAPAPAGGHVLLIEDDGFERQRVRELLQSAGFEVSAASSGAEGIELLRSRHFDAVVLDLVMPGMTGLDVLRTARADDRLADVPFVVLSALYMTNNERAVLGPKVASVVRKGDATAAELAHALRQAIKRRPEEVHPLPNPSAGGPDV